MGEPANDTMSTIIPALSYRDAPGAISWLEKAFGFRKRLVVANPDGTIAHAEMSFGTAVIMVATSREDRSWKSPLDLGGVNQSLCVYVSDPDEHYRHAQEAGARSPSSCTTPTTDLAATRPRTLKATSGRSTSIGPAVIGPTNREGFQAMMVLTTSPWTSVSRMSRPPNREVRRVWSMPSRCSMVACRSWTSTLFSTA